MSRGIRRKQQKDFEAQLEDAGCNPVEILIMIAHNDVPCSVCQRTPGKQRVALEKASECKCGQSTGLYDPDCWRCSGTGLATATERVCQSCYGTLYEAVSPKVRADVCTTMLNKLVPDLRSIEVRGNIQLEAVAVFERLARGRERIAQPVAIDAAAKQIEASEE